MSLRDFFIAPPDEAPQPARRPQPTRDRHRRRPPRSARPRPHAAETPSPRNATTRGARTRTGFAPPTPADAVPPASHGFAPPDAPHDGAPPERGFAPPDDPAYDPDFAPPYDATDVLPREIVGAAVVGRPGEAEPLAAAIALVLRRLTAARAASVVVVGATAPPTPGAAAPAARRLAARLAAHGFEQVAARGLLAWTHATPETATRAAFVGAPAVLAVTIALTPALEEAITEQELVVVVTQEPEGALAELARSALTRPKLSVTAARPLPRGIARVLARAGLAAPRAAKELL
jgi:hypothetical protein